MVRGPATAGKLRLEISRGLWLIVSRLLPHRPCPLIPVAPLLKGWIFKPFRCWTVRSEEHRAKSERAETRGCLSRVCGCTLLIDMSATEIIEQFKALPAAERAQVAKFVVEND